MSPLDQHYRFAPGFAFRREAFGGLLYHYEGVQPDPRVTLVDSPFLIDVLQVVHDHPEHTLSGLLGEVNAHFGLQPGQQRRVERFLSTLISRGGLAPAGPGSAARACGVCAGTATDAPVPPARPGHGGQSAALAGAVGEQGLSAPITVTWEVTNRCNLRCTHCLSASGPEADVRDELGLEEALGVVDQLAAARVFQIHFGGGEPFVYPGFGELMRHAQARGFCCLCISTNGALLGERRVAELDAMGGIYLQLSLDGASEATCDALRGAGTYRKVLGALERMRGTRIVRTINFVYTRSNAHELDAMLALVRRHEATLRVTRLKPSGRGAALYTRLRPTQEQLAHLHGWLGAHDDVLTGDTFFHLNAFGGRPLKGFQACGAARLTGLIVPNGDVYPCAFTQTEVFRAGNVRRQDFGDIWANAPVFNKVFRAPTGGACATCPSFGGCGGGCPAVKHALTGRLDLPDPDCVLETARARGREPAPLCAD